ncbi:hypothetical protein [Nesterenkonia cremea]|uniref:Uncharacterized protein n=1 Tax=Nesterenkonia cremea TaxID=1882340 RepID=A0A917EQV6_9MICC|nr:hypothetical protein [Nesterenkonia cremea]GGE77153.1 hypothetical protein GCM10011401_25620 [Nesterenkonia cremea]
MDMLIDAGIVIGALAVSAALGALLVSVVLRWVEPEGYAPGVLRGGTWIGVLERLAITGATIAGYPEAVAVVLAVKGLGRYPELRATGTDQRAKATERFIIGTLASYLWAGLIGVLATLLF